MTESELRKAIALVNSTQRGPNDPPLVHYVECQRCGNGFAKQTQDLRYAEKFGHPHLCRLCKS